jgi:N,N'-diacetylchitobiose transport system substrate-binding protein
MSTLRKKLIEEDRVKRRIAVAATLAVALIGMAACSSGSKTSGTGAKLSGPTDGKGVTLTAWIMADAQNNPQWLPILNDAIARFKTATGADVKVNFTNWGNHLQQLDTALGSSTVPDVVELGNTEAPKYVFNGALADLSGVKGSFENSATWLDGLSGGCTMDGKTYCVPYYAGTRLSIYRTDLFSAVGATSAPTTQADLLSDLDKIKAANAGNKNFVAWNMPGRYWYAGMSYVYTYGGTIADKVDGKWKGELESPAAQQGLTAWANIVKNYSTPTSQTVNEQDMDTLFETGNVAMEYDNGWHKSVVQQVHTNPNDPTSPFKDTPVKDKVDLFAMPGTDAAHPFKSFLGGSVLGIPAASKYQALAAQFVKFYTDAKSETAFISLGNLPNATSLLATASANPAVGPQVAAAAQASWFTPSAPKWADVESQQVLQQMCQDIATGAKSPADAAAAADVKIAQILNAG